MESGGGQAGTFKCDGDELGDEESCGGCVLFG